MMSEHQRSLSFALFLVLGAVSAGAAPSNASGRPAERGRRAAVHQAQARPPVPAAALKQVVVNGARCFTERDVAAFLELRIDAPLPASPAQLAQDLQRRYAAQGYSFAQVAARFDEDNGQLTFDVDEGHIDAVEFAGVRTDLAHEFANDFALQPGDVFCRTEATRALSVLLQPTQGAVCPAETSAGLSTLPRPLTTPFEMIERDGKRVLIVHATLTVGTIAEGEINGVSQALFGGDSQSSGLGALGKFFFQRVLRLADYLDSTSSDSAFLRRSLTVYSPPVS
jgi:hypothetical protein